jgi:hypothetical protein
MGNFLGLSANQGYPPVKRTAHYYDTDRQTAAEMYAVASREVPRYIERLLAAGYPYHATVINTAGFFTDNGAPDDRWCEVIRLWNEEHSDITLQTATMSEWFDVIEAEIGGRELPTYATAWPDHWAHGLGSETAAVALARQTQRRRDGVTGLVKTSGSVPAAGFLEKALEEERFALEHTFDAWCTSFRPASPLNPFEQITKELFFYHADLYLDEAVESSLRAMVPTRPEQPCLFVYNPGQAARRLVHFDALDYEAQPEKQALADEDGKLSAFQLDDDSIPRYVACLTLKAGLNRFTLVEHAASVEDRAGSTGELESSAWRLKIDASTGGLSSLIENGNEREWVDGAREFGFGQLVHEAVIHPLGREACGNSARLIALDVVTDEARARMAPGPVFEHTTLKIAAGSERINGPVYDVVRMKGSADVSGPVRIDWRVYHDLPVVELNLEWDKHWCDLPEAAYVAFPFLASNALLALETGGGFFVPGSHADGGQLPGTCSSYYTIQRAARIQPKDGDGLLWLPLDAPLVMTNEINYNRWETGPYAWNGLLASMPVNHYWHTNFPTSQRGILKLRYRMISRQGWSDDEAAILAAMPLETTGWR